MKERITFVHGINDEFDPKQLRLDNDTLHINSLKAAREDRITFGLYELPQELWRVLKQSQEIHLRWVSPKPYTSIVPFISRASPGLHVFFTAQRNRSVELLCPLLWKTFGADIKCASPEKTFTSFSTASSRFTSSAAQQYHDLVPSLNDLITYIKLKICTSSDERCIAKASSLSTVDYLDVDYDAISQSLVLTTVQHQAPPPGAWTAKFQKPGVSSKTEVGILAGEKAIEREQLSLGGFLTTVGESTKLSPTLFSFPSRHHPSLPSSGESYKVSLPSPTGLHPTLRITFPSTSMPPPFLTCSLHAYLILPSPLFPDKYQLSSPLFLASKNLRALRALSGETDLEAPNWVVTKWGSALLLELALPELPSRPTLAETTPWHASIPLHLRYMPPTRNGTALVSIPWPVVFWACPTDEGTKLGTNPFDRAHLGYESLFGPRTMFYHLQPESSTLLVDQVHLPVLEAGWDEWVQAGTLGAVVLGFLWVLGTLVRVLRGEVRRKKRD